MENFWSVVNSYTYVLNPQGQPKFWAEILVKNCWEMLQNQNFECKLSPGDLVLNLLFCTFFLFGISWDCWDVVKKNWDVEICVGETNWEVLLKKNVQINLLVW